jgi:AraC-like DNA-binding protein
MLRSHLDVIAPPALDCRTTGARSRVGAYVEFAPSPALAGIVECSWVHVVASGATSGARGWHRVLPDDALSLAFSCTRGGDGLTIEPHLGILGPVTKPRLYPILPGREMVAIKVRPEWAPAILGAFASDHADTFEDATPILTTGGRDVGGRDVLGRLASSRDWREALRVLWRVVAGQLAREPARLTNGGVAHRVLHVLRSAPPSAPVRWAAGELRMSPRHLRRVVVDAVGRTPLDLYRNWRFLRALALADAVARPSWAQLAARCGYADQSHLVRDFHELTGETPDRLAAERRRESDSSPAPL